MEKGNWGIRIFALVMLLISVGLTWGQWNLVRTFGKAETEDILQYVVAMFWLIPALIILTFFPFFVAYFLGYLIVKGRVPKAMEDDMAWVAVLLVIAIGCMFWIPVVEKADNPMFAPLNELHRRLLSN